MTYGYIEHPEEIDKDIAIPKGQVTAGSAIGILTYETWYPLFPGNVTNASSFPFPVIYKKLNGVESAAMISGDPAVSSVLIQAARELTAQGARAIIGACNYFSNYQKETAAALDVPVFLSALLQVPLIRLGLKPGKKIILIGMNAAAITSHMLDQCGIHDTSDIVIIGAGHLAECSNILNDTGHFNSAKMKRELVDLSQKTVTQHPEAGALLFYCSDIATYAWSVQNAVQLPVFDYTTLINWVYSGVVRRPYSGIL